jgi:hypothetical protein
MAGYGKPQGRVTLDPVSDPDEPRLRTPLGQRLWLLRQLAVRSGEPLLDWDDLSREVAERRGEKIGRPIHRISGILVTTIHPG